MAGWLAGTPGENSHTHPGGGTCSSKASRQRMYCSGSRTMSRDTGNSISGTYCSRRSTCWMRKRWVRPLPSCETGRTIGDPAEARILASATRLARFGKAPPKKPEHPRNSTKNFGPCWFRHDSNLHNEFQKNFETDI